MRNNIIGLDTNIFAYQFQKHPQFGHLAERIFADIIAHNKKAVTSIVSMIELLSARRPEEEINKLYSLFLETPNLAVYDVNQSIAVESARLRRTYRFRSPDAIQIATAMYAKADVFITNDKRLLSCKEIKIKPL